MRTLILTMALILAAESSMAQEEPGLYRLYAEFAGGSTGLINVNLERVVLTDLRARFGFGFGWYQDDCRRIPDMFMGHSTSCADDVNASYALVMLNRLLGEGRHTIEVGGGMAVSQVEGSYASRSYAAATQLSTLASVGYRYEGERRLVRLTLTPSLGLADVAPPFDGLKWNIGVSIGYAR